MQIIGNLVTSTEWYTFKDIAPKTDRSDTDTHIRTDVSTKQTLYTPTSLKRGYNNEIKGHIIF